MVKIGVATILLAVLRSAIIVALALAAAAALTHYVALPEPLGTLAWIVAGGYSAFVIGVTALMLAASAQDTIIRRTAPKRVRGRKLR